MSTFTVAGDVVAPGVAGVVGVVVGGVVATGGGEADALEAAAGAAAAAPAPTAGEVAEIDVDADVDPGAGDAAEDVAAVPGAGAFCCARALGSATSGSASARTIVTRRRMGNSPWFGALESGATARLDAACLSRCLVHRRPANKKAP
ncbi:MAG: hypothetical protein JOZ69_08525 [Myxococcales bacterium]|nr:hypothetical protein [Myxococcales bacterium]